MQVVIERLKDAFINDQGLKVTLREVTSNSIMHNWHRALSYHAIMPEVY
jgi:hypothetical protein